MKITLQHGITRSSIYVPMSDGVRIAVDVFAPARQGEQSTNPLPLIWAATPYRRAYAKDGELVHFLHPDKNQAFLNDVCKQGYVIAVADIRGTGASFGHYVTTYSAREIDDAVELMQWFSEQPWCDGNIGMYGRSYLGYHQYQAILGASPHLKAIFPCVSTFDRPAVIWPGGVYVKSFFEDWFALKKMCDTSPDTARVDEDGDGSLLRQAQCEHANNVYQLGIANTPYREDLDPSSLGMALPRGHPPTPVGSLDQLNAACMPTYNVGGWFDFSPRCTALLHANLNSPRKLLMGPWHHGQTDGFDIGAEMLDWFNHWLKGADNKVMAKPAVTYCLEDANWNRHWRTAATWPLPDIGSSHWYLHDQDLLPSQPKGSSVRTTTADQRLSMGTDSRWKADLSAPAPMMRTDISWMAQVCPSFTSKPFLVDFELAGHPVVHLHASCQAPDFDTVVYLAEVCEDGTTHYLGEGLIRASFRAEHKAPFKTVGLPYRRQCRADVLPYKAGTPVLLRIELTPIGRLVKAGHRLRVSVCTGDGNIYETLNLPASTKYRIHSEPAHRSWIELPLRPTKR